MVLKKHWTLAEAHEALKRLTRPLSPEDPLVRQAYEKCTPKKVVAGKGRQKTEPHHAS